jgi:hypothetical protein
LPDFGQQLFLFFLHPKTASTVPHGSSFMKRKTLATIVITILLLFMMVWSFGSSAANNATEPEQSREQGRSTSVFADKGEGDDDYEPDADLGKFGRRIDREEYLRERDEYIARKRGIEPGRPFDPGLRGRAIETMERQEKNRRLESIINGDITPAAGGAWTPIGPRPIPNGVGSSTGPTSGRVTAIAIDPTNSNKIYLGTAQGGVWRSLDGGTNWTSVFDNAQTQAIGALAIAPSSPSTLFVGTGEFNSCADCFFGVGLYRIDNADGAATLVGPINPQQTIGNLTYNVFNGRSITRILVHPTDPNTIWVSTARGVGGSGANPLGAVGGAMATRGVYRSTNALSSTPSFQKLVVNTDASVDSPATGNADAVDMVMEPGVPNNILVAVIGQTNNLGGIYQTTNATAATPTFTQTQQLPVGTRTTLAINKVGSTVTVYAATSETPANTPGCSTANSGAVRKSTNGGATWSDQLAGGGGFCAGQCFYDMPIAVDPFDANLVYIGGQTSSTCGRLVGRSTDGGNTFVANSSGIHADNHVLVFDGVGNIYTGTDGGVWKQSTCATANAAWTNLNAGGLNTLQFESIAVHPTDQFLMIGGTQDNGTEAQQTSSGNWIRAESGDGGYSLIDQSATDTTNVTMYHTFFNNSSQIGFDRIFKTACIGTGSLFDSWPARGRFGGNFNPNPVACDGGTPLYQDNGLVLTSTVLFYAPMALGPGSPNTVYFGADRLYRSNDRGDTMTVVSQVPLAGTSPISSIAIAPTDDNVRIAGTQSGQVWGTSTGSSTLVNITPPTPANPAGGTNKFIGRAMVDPTNANVAYVTLSYYAPAGQGIWKITNLVAAAGSSPVAATWQAAGNGIPSVPINAFAVDPANANNLFAGTDIGVYFSSDAGATWTPYGAGLPRVAVFDLQIQTSNRILRAATHGRGIWETSITGAALTPPPAPPTLTNPTNPIDQADIFVRQHYGDFLSRSPDFSGLSFWTMQITNCRCDQACTDVARINTSGAFFLSIEFQQTGYLVERMYKTAFGDAQQTSNLGGSPHQIPAPIIRFSEFLTDVAQIGQGVVVLQPGWETVLENNKVAFSQAFVQRSTFTSPANYPTSMSPTAFVDKMFLRASVTPSATDRNTAINEFGGSADISNVANRARAFRDVAENAILQTQEKNSAFVLMQYFGYLRRNPNDAPDLTRDYTGYEFWLSKLNQFNGDFIAAEMVKAFISSTEYRQRFGTN